MGGIFGGGGGGSSAPAPPAPQPVNYGAMYAAAIKYGPQMYDQQLAAQVKAYPQLEELSLGSVRKLAGNLDNSYTQQAKGVIDQTYRQGASALADTGNRINALGDLSASVARDAQGRALSGPTSIEQNLYDNAASDLALGRSLNAEEARNASQAARGAFAARGLGVGSGAAAAEILNRDAYATSRYQQRLANAQTANQIREQGVQGRQTAALGMLGNTANIYGQGGGAYQNAANLGFGGANALVNLDPYQRALGIGVNLGSGVQGQSGAMIGNAYNGALDTAGNVASFNTNMAASQYNSYQNNQAALAGSQTASNGAMLGAGIGAVGMIGAAAVF